ncbi:MAG: chorismate synthase [Treponema sp.]|nr:chorismate synthase [Treponema sp.]
MAGNIFGGVFRVLSFGESHGPATGCVIDGCPAGVSLDVQDIARDLSRRRPGNGGPGISPRNEQDEPEILSGVFGGKTLGTPIAIIIRNTNQHSEDYDDLKDLYRPGHADWTWEAKYGFRDHRGGGRSSGRETAARVAAGAVARAFLALSGITVTAWVSQAAGINSPGPGDPAFDPAAAAANLLRVPGRTGQAGKRIEELAARGDSAGGVVSCRVSSLPPGLGEPVFGKLFARIGEAVLSIGACRGVEFGAGFASAGLRGSENNDEPIPARESSDGLPADKPGPPTAETGLPPGVPRLSFKTNRAGGSLGGISTGMDVEFRAAFKPVASIGMAQKTVNRNGEITECRITGRHDACILPRVVPVVEAMTALVIADLTLQHRSARI